MSTAADSNLRAAAGKPRYRLEVNSFDRVSSLLVSLLVLVGVTVAVLFIIFLFRRFSPDEAPALLIPISKARGEPVKGYEDEIQPPGLEDAPSDLPPELQDTLKELTNAISNKTAILAKENFSADSVAGQGGGPGNREYDGDGGEGGNAPIKELRFEARSDDDYAAMIDYFGGELAVLDIKANKIRYAKKLGQPKPDTRIGEPGEEKRFAFRATGQPLAPIEVRLARKAGIMRAPSILVVYYPDEVTQQIYALEQAEMRKAGKTTLEEVDRTIYRVERDGRTYKFNVEEQTYF